MKVKDMVKVIICYQLIIFFIVIITGRSILEWALYWRMLIFA